MARLLEQFKGCMVGGLVGKFFVVVYHVSIIANGNGESEYVVA